MKPQAFAYSVDGTHDLLSVQVLHHMANIHQDGQRVVH